MNFIHIDQIDNDDEDYDVYRIIRRNNILVSDENEDSNKVFYREKVRVVIINLLLFVYPDDIQNQVYDKVSKIIIIHR